MKLKRIFSIVLSIMILAGALTQIIPASANTNGNSANEFYISVSGSDENDGTTHNTAVRTVKKAIELINAAGLGENDTATVYVDSTVDGAQPTAIDSINNFISYYNSENNIIPAYNCTVIFTSYNAGDVGISYMGFGPYAAGKEGGNNYGEYMYIAGPTVFKNINLLDGSMNLWWLNPIDLRGNTSVFHNVTWEYLDSNKKIQVGKKPNGFDVRSLYSGNTVQSNKTYAQPFNNSRERTVAFEGQSQVNLPVTFYFGNESPEYKYNRVFEGDSTFIWGIKDKTLTAAYLVGASGTTGDAAAFNYNGNVNIVMKNGAKISSIKVSPDESNYLSPKISGAVQIVANAGSEINTADIAAIAKVYTDNSIYAITNGSSDITLDVTNTAGMYKVSGTGIAYILDGNKIYFSKNGYITVPETDSKLKQYTVLSAESLDEIKSFGWKQDATGSFLIPEKDNYMLHIKNKSYEGCVGLEINKDKLKADTVYTVSFKYKSENADVFAGDILRTRIMASDTDKISYENVSKVLKQTTYDTSILNGTFNDLQNEKSNNNGTMLLTFTLTEEELGAERYSLCFSFIPRSGWKTVDCYISDLKLCEYGSEENILTNDGSNSALAGWHGLETSNFAKGLSHNATFTRDSNSCYVEYIDYNDANADRQYNICDLVAVNKAKDYFYSDESLNTARQMLLAQ